MGWARGLAGLSKYRSGLNQQCFEAAERDSLHQGRYKAARRLIGTADGEYLQDGELSVEQFDAKLKEIGDWVCKKFRLRRSFWCAEKDLWRVIAPRKRAGEKVNRRSGNPYKVAGRRY